MLVGMGVVVDLQADTWGLTLGSNWIVLELDHVSTLCSENITLWNFRRYLSAKEGIPDLEALQNLLQMTTMQIQYAANRRN